MRRLEGISTPQLRSSAPRPASRLYPKRDTEFKPYQLKPKRDTNVEPSIVEPPMELPPGAKCPTSRYPKKLK